MNIVLVLFLGTVLLFLLALDSAHRRAEYLRLALEQSKDDGRRLWNIIRQLEHQIGHPNEQLFSTASYEPVTSTLEQPE